MTPPMQSSIRPLMTVMTTLHTALLCFAATPLHLNHCIVEAILSLEPFAPEHSLWIYLPNSIIPIINTAVHLPCFTGRQRWLRLCYVRLAAILSSDVAEDLEESLVSLGCR